ncbi:DUF99 family protein [Deinococcus metallilatus]|uniref:DUF99 family protein n=1 Tax=Deinococcus metallilatus TaxID=1211322 RepID=A0AAJ5F3S8_9DEIO|nr:DUF99 family protein [Deinococcus metallilatus]MBB5295111.1 hypothetical protein [Deinococcus metallilatus]QBY08710.1 DUF99 family protein [Deinococcus metallilatus]RXJ10589.1 DUF99 family protein [Deinococcus metallilatus]TLK26560.1 DUF99 family protein [Deinococcus metallilatus]GMA14883.1 UPF0215 protein [Deinococcus metallilatus]
MSFSHAIGFDDAPFAREHRGNVAIYGTVYARDTLHGVVSGRVRRDGRNSTSELARLVTASGAREHLHLILLQGVALAGFNVVDAPALSALTGLPVLIVARRPPDVDRLRAALLTRVPGGARKWRLIEALGPMEPCRGVWVQRVGLSLPQAEAALATLTVTGRIPEPLRAAHLIAGGVTRGSSRGGRV